MTQVIADPEPTTPTSSNPDFSNGCMIALPVPQDAAQRHAVPDGLPPEDLHVTLVFLGDADQIAPEQRQAITDAVRSVTEQAPGPLQGTFPSGHGVFNPEGDADSRPYWAAPDVPGLPELRQQLLAELDDRGVGGLVSRDHGFTPHVTLSYLKPGQEPPMNQPDAPPGEPIEFSDVSLVMGDDEIRYPLSSTPLPDTPLAAAASPARRRRAIPISPDVDRVLSRMVREHNSRVATQDRVRLPVARAVYARGVSSFSIDSNPGMTRDGYAFARVDRFLGNIASQRYLQAHESRYTEDLQDLDLLPARFLSPTRVTLTQAASTLRASGSDDLVRLLVSAAPLAPGDVRRRFTLSRALAAARSAGPATALALPALEALVADGNSRAARSARARRQLRDRFGRWIEMGGGIRFKIRSPGAPGGGRWYHGTAVGTDPANGLVQVALDEASGGNTVSVPANKVEKLKARLGDTSGPTPDAPSPNGLTPSAPYVPPSRAEVSDALTQARESAIAKSPGTAPSGQHPVIRFSRLADEDFQADLPSDRHMESAPSRKAAATRFRSLARGARAAAEGQPSLAPALTGWADEVDALANRLDPALDREGAIARIPGGDDENARALPDIDPREMNDAPDVTPPADDPADTPLSRHAADVISQAIEDVPDESTAGQQRDQFTDRLGDAVDALEAGDTNAGDDLRQLVDDIDTVVQNDTDLTPDEKAGLQRLAEGVQEIAGEAPASPTAEDVTPSPSGPSPEQEQAIRNVAEKLRAAKPDATPQEMYSWVKGNLDPNLPQYGGRMGDTPVEDRPSPEDIRTAHQYLSRHGEEASPRGSSGRGLWTEAGYRDAAASRELGRIAGEPTPAQAPEPDVVPEDVTPEPGIDDLEGPSPEDLIDEPSENPDPPAEPDLSNPLPNDELGQNLVDTSRGPLHQLFSQVDPSAGDGEFKDEARRARNITLNVGQMLQSGEMEQGEARAHMQQVSDQLSALYDSYEMDPDLEDLLNEAQGNIDKVIRDLNEPTDADLAGVHVPEPDEEVPDLPSDDELLNPEAPAPRRRGRPPGSRNRPRTPAPAPAEEAPAVEEPAAVPEPQAPAVPGDQTDQFGNPVAQGYSLAEERMIGDNEIQDWVSDDGQFTVTVAKTPVALDGIDRGDPVYVLKRADGTPVGNYPTFVDAADAGGTDLARGVPEPDVETPGVPEANAGRGARRERIDNNLDNSDRPLPPGWVVDDVMADELVARNDTGDLVAFTDENGNIDLAERLPNGSYRSIGQFQDWDEAERAADEHRAPAPAPTPQEAVPEEAPTPEPEVPAAPEEPAAARLVPRGRRVYTPEEAQALPVGTIVNINREPWQKIGENQWQSGRTGNGGSDQFVADNNGRVRSIGGQGLPVGSVVRDGEGRSWTKQGDNDWLNPEDDTHGSDLFIQTYGRNIQSVGDGAPGRTELPSEGRTWQPDTPERNEGQGTEGPNAPAEALPEEAPEVPAAPEEAPGGAPEGFNPAAVDFVTAMRVDREDRQAIADWAAGNQDLTELPEEQRARINEVLQRRLRRTHRLDDEPEARAQLEDLSRRLEDPNAAPEVPTPEPNAPDGTQEEPFELTPEGAPEGFSESAIAFVERMRFPNRDDAAAVQEWINGNLDLTQLPEEQRARINEVFKRRLRRTHQLDDDPTARQQLEELSRRLDSGEAQAPPAPAPDEGFALPDMEDVTPEKPDMTDFVPLERLDPSVPERSDVRDMAIAMNEWGLDEATLDEVNTALFSAAAQMEAGNDQIAGANLAYALVQLDDAQSTNPEVATAIQQLDSWMRGLDPEFSPGETPDFALPDMIDESPTDDSAGTLDMGRAVAILEGANDLIDAGPDNIPPRDRRVLHDSMARARAALDDGDSEGAINALSETLNYMDTLPGEDRTMAEGAIEQLIEGLGGSRRPAKALPEETAPETPAAPAAPATPEAPAVPERPAGSQGDARTRYTTEGVVTGRDGQDLHAGRRVVSPRGEQGVIVSVQEEPPYARVQFDDGRQRSRSARQLSIAADAEPAPGAEAVEVPGPRPGGARDLTGPQGEELAAIERNLGNMALTPQEESSIRNALDMASAGSAEGRPEDVRRGLQVAHDRLDARLRRRGRVPTNVRSARDSLREMLDGLAPGEQPTRIPATPATPEPLTPRTISGDVPDANFIQTLGTAGGLQALRVEPGYRAEIMQSIRGAIDADQRDDPNSRQAYLEDAYERLHNAFDARPGVVNSVRESTLNTLRDAITRGDATWTDPRPPVRTQPAGWGTTSTPNQLQRHLPELDQTTNPMNMAQFGIPDEAQAAFAEYVDEAVEADRRGETDDARNHLGNALQLLRDEFGDRPSSIQNYPIANLEAAYRSLGGNPNDITSQGPGGSRSGGRGATGSVPESSTIWSEFLVDPANSGDQRAPGVGPNRGTPGVTVDESALPENAAPAIIEHRPTDFSEWGDRAGEISQAGNERPDLGQISTMLQNGDRAGAQHAILQAFGADGGYSFGNGFTVELSASGYGSQVEVTGRIRSADGRSVGSITRNLSFDSRGNIQRVYNAYMKFNDGESGGGFAQAYNRFMENWYIANGVPKVEVTAAGGYGWTGAHVWAINGFEFKDERYELNYRVPDIVRTARNANVPGIQEEAQALEDKWRSGAKIMPYELSMFGWRPGLKTWIGKDYMIEREWGGVKYLTPDSASSQLIDSTSRIGAARARAGKGANAVNAPDLARAAREGTLADGDTAAAQELAQYADEIDRAFANNRSLAELSPGAKRTLQKALRAQMLAGARDVDQGELLEAVKALNNEYRIEHPDNVQLGTANRIQEVSWDDIQHKNVPGFRVQTITEYGGTAGHNERIARGGLSNIFVLTDEDTGQRFLVKMDKFSNKSGAEDNFSREHEIQAMDFFRGAGLHSIGYSVGHPEPGVIIQQFAGDSAELSVRPVDAKQMPTDTRNQALRNLRNPEDFMTITMGDALMGNADRHEGNYQLGQDSDGRWWIFPIDSNLSFDNSKGEGMGFLGLDRYLQAHSDLDEDAQITAAINDVFTNTGTAASFVRQSSRRAVRDLINKLGAEQAGRVLASTFDNYRASLDKLRSLDPDSRARVISALDKLSSDPRYLAAVVNFFTAT